jgi:hypothetical protein
MSKGLFFKNEVETSKGGLFSKDDNDKKLNYQ